VKRHLILALLLLFIPAALFAQTGGAALRGRVDDASGAALPGVTVTATNNATGFSRSTVTGSDGSYYFASLPVGMYNVVADLSGFASVTTRNVELNVSQERELNITVKQAAVKEQITVTAQAPLVETTPAVSTVVSQKEIQNLPLNGRQFANLGSLAPGTTLSVNADPTKPGQMTIALNGGSGRNVNFVIDGGDNTDDTIGGALQNFNIEAVQEFTHVAMPEENAYIEVFHSILDRELIQRIEFSSFYDAKKRIDDYILNWYNDRRRHKEIGRVTPNQKWAQNQWWSSDKLRGTGSALVLSRPDDAFEIIKNNHPLCISLDKTGDDPYLGLSDDQHGKKY